MEELWKDIPEFPRYQISNLGRVYNKKYDHIMRPSFSNYGQMKITLTSDWMGERYTRSVAQMVAEAFVSPFNDLYDQVVLLDGNFANVAAENLVWRPVWFAWIYVRQQRTIQPIHYHNLLVHEITNDVLFNSIIEAGTTLGLLYRDIWESTYTGKNIIPYGAIFEIVK